MCPSQAAAGALPGAEGPDDEGGADQGLYLPPRGTHLLQTGARQGSQAGTTFLLLARSLFLLLFLPVLLLPSLFIPPSFFLLFLCFLISYFLETGARQGSQARTTFLLLACSLSLDLVLYLG